MFENDYDFSLVPWFCVREQFRVTKWLKHLFY